MFINGTGHCFCEITVDFSHKNIPLKANSRCQKSDLIIQFYFRPNFYLKWLGYFTWCDVRHLVLSSKRVRFDVAFFAGLLDGDGVPGNKSDMQHWLGFLVEQCVCIEGLLIWKTTGLWHPFITPMKSWSQCNPVIINTGHSWHVNIVWDGHKHTTSTVLYH